jgi:hypothetical protein
VVEGYARGSGGEQLILVLRAINWMVLVELINEKIDRF